MREELLAQAIDLLSTVPNVEMDPDSLADDVLFLSLVWPEERTFAAAVASTGRALEQLAKGSVMNAKLKYDFSDWESFHYQSSRAQGAKADMRIIFQRRDAHIRVLGFGHRHLPLDFYRRMAAGRLKEEGSDE